MRTKVITILALILAGILIKSILNNIKWLNCELSEILLYPILIWGIYLFIDLFEKNDKNTVINVCLLTCGFVVSIFINIHPANIEQGLIKSISCLIGAGLLLLYLKLPLANKKG